MASIYCLAQPYKYMVFFAWGQFIIYNDIFILYILLQTPDANHPIFKIIIHAIKIL